MKKSILGKNIKVTMVSEEAKAKGLADTEKVQKESGKFNKEGMEAYNKLADLYDFDNGEEDALENPPKYTRDDFEEEYTIARDAGGMNSIDYDNEDTEVFKSFMERIDKLNDTSEYDKEFGTKDGFGEGEKDNVYDENKENSEKYKKHRKEYQPTPPVRAIHAEEIKESKTMKRLNFKQTFKDETHMMSLIKEDYKTDGNTFLMTDGNETYKVRWEGDNTLGEGVVLQYQNKERINEDKENMKKLFNYKKSDVVGKTNSYINESIQFKKMMDIIKGKNVISEQSSLSGDEKAAVDKIKKAIEGMGTDEEALWSALDELAVASDGEIAKGEEIAKGVSLVKKLDPMFGGNFFKTLHDEMDTPQEKRTLKVKSDGLVGTGTERGEYNGYYRKAIGGKPTNPNNIDGTGIKLAGGNAVYR